MSAGTASANTSGRTASGYDEGSYGGGALAPFLTGFVHPTTAASFAAKPNQIVFGSFQILL